MKKILALILCLALLTALAACGSDETSVTASNEGVTPTSETADVSDSSEEHDHTHINYRGRETVFTAEDLVEIEGREWDFTYDQSGSTIYIYNDVTVDELRFSQVQFSFTDSYARVSATYSAEQGATDEQILQDTEEAMQTYLDALTAIYGEGASGEQHGSTYVSWNDHSGNYIILTRINDTTIQVAYYIYATA